MHMCEHLYTKEAQTCSHHPHPLLPTHTPLPLPSHILLLPPHSSNLSTHLTPCPPTPSYTPHTSHTSLLPTHLTPSYTPHTSSHTSLLPIHLSPSHTPHSFPHTSLLPAHFQLADTFSPGCTSCVLRLKALAPSTNTTLANNTRANSSLSH